MAEELLWEQLYDLYVAECDRDNTKPRLSDFFVWAEEKGYGDDRTD
jgi:hypothetical protein